MYSAGGGVVRLARRKAYSTTRNDSRNRMFVNHLGYGIAKQHNVLIEGFDLTLQFNPVDEINGNRNMLVTQGVEKWILQELAFVIAHDIFRVQKLIELDLTTPTQTGK